MSWLAVAPLRCISACHRSRPSALGRLTWRPYSTGAPDPPKDRNTGFLDVQHSHFIANASPKASWKAEGFGTFNEGEEPSVDELEGVSEGRGKLLPTATHLFKLILPLGNLSHPSSTRTHPRASEFSPDSKSISPPTVMLLHPSQPLSHVGSLIRASLAPATPIVSFRSRSTKGQAFQWSDSTDIGDFIRDAARSAKFMICLTYHPSKHLSETTLQQDTEKVVAVNDEGGTKGKDILETVIEVKVPTFADRTRFLRRRLQSVESQISSMEGLKSHCEREAHRGARRMAVTGFGMLVVYWASVARLTFWDYGWDVMEPVTYLSGLSTVILGYLWFLYQGREVSYSSVLAQSISKRRDTLYKTHGFDVERWMDLVGERKSLRKEIGRIAEDYEDAEASDYVEDATDTGKPQDGDLAKVDLAESNAEMSEGKKEEKIGQRMASKANREE